MSATQRIIDKLLADNVRILQQPRPEGLDEPGNDNQRREFADTVHSAMRENNRKIGILRKQIGG